MSELAPMKKSERIARALCRAYDDDPDAMVLPFHVPQMANGGRYMLLPRGMDPQPLWTMRLRDAFAALEGLGLADS